MELDQNLSGSLGEPHQGFLDSGKTTKTPLRMLYAAETQVFKAQYGNLENIRQKLGFSRRKMCQLLLVDPSAWTRWCKDESKVPPHVYRALEWFLALNQKALTSPDLAAVFTARYKVQAGVKSERLVNDHAIMVAEVSLLKAELKKQRLISVMLTAGLFALGIVSILNVI